MKKRAKRTINKKMILMILVVLIAMPCVIGISIKKMPKTYAEERTDRYKYYTSVYVEPGDTLWDIAKEYTSEEYEDIRDYIDEVCQINGISNPNKLRSGTHILVPYYSSEYK